MLPVKFWAICPIRFYDDAAAQAIVSQFNARYADNDSDFAPTMATRKDVSGRPVISI
jgi:hypothetical protein